MAELSPELVERVARKVNPATWAEIDRLRRAAKCYLETPFERGGFESEESARAFAQQREEEAYRLELTSLNSANRYFEASGHADLQQRNDELVEALERYNAWATGAREFTDGEFTEMMNSSSALLAKHGRGGK